MLPSPSSGTEFAAVAPRTGLRAFILLEALRDGGTVFARATGEERKRIVQTIFEAVYVKDKEVAAVRPKPGYYDLLLDATCGDDGDRAPVWQHPNFGAGSGSLEIALCFSFRPLAT